MLQPQGVGKIDLLAGVMVVEDNGSVTVNGNLTITGSLAANEYRGIDGNFNINLAKDSQEAESGFGMLNVYGQDNQLVASVDETGTLILPETLPPLVQHVCQAEYWIEEVAPW